MLSSHMLRPLESGHCETNGISSLVLAVAKRGRATATAAPGDHLAEPGLAEDPRVRRGPVRETLLRLQVDGQIEIRRYKGAFVSILTTLDVEEVHTLRKAIEQLTTERAATMLTAEHVAKFDKILEAMTVARARSNLGRPCAWICRSTTGSTRRLTTFDYSAPGLEPPSGLVLPLHATCTDFPTVGFPERKTFATLCAVAIPLSRAQRRPNPSSGACTRPSQLEPSREGVRIRRVRGDGRSPSLPVGAGPWSGIKEALPGSREGADGTLTTRPGCRRLGGTWACANGVGTGRPGARPPRRSARPGPVQWAGGCTRRRR